MGARWRIAILLAVITTINYVDRSVFGLVAPVTRGEFDINDAVFFKLPTELSPADRVAIAWGLCGMVRSLGGSLLGLLVGSMIEEVGCESVFLLTSSLHLIYAVLLKIFLPKPHWSAIYSLCAAASSAPKL